MTEITQIHLFNIITILSLCHKNLHTQLNQQYSLFSNQTVTFFSWPPALNVEPADFLNKGPMVTIFGLQSNANLECAVDQLATHLASLNLPTVIVFGPRFKSDRVCDALRNSQIKDQVSLRWINNITVFKEKTICSYTQLLNNKCFSDYIKMSQLCLHLCNVPFTLLIFNFIMN
jgi:hypothetical protein